MNLSGPAEPVRSRLLERLLADARRGAAPDWRQVAYAQLVPGGVLPPLAAARLAACGATAEGYALLASAVHCVAGLSNVRLPADGLLRLSEAEAQQLAADFAIVWRGAPVRLIATGDMLCCVFESALQVQTQDPQRARGRLVDGFTPTGKDAPRLRALSSEIEMWLFEHALNRARAARGSLPVNGLWLWGGGHAPIAPPQIGGGAYGEDVFFDTFKVAQARDAQLLVTEAVPGTEAWAAVESDWLAPAALALRQGRVTGLTLSAGEQLWQVRAGWRLRFWRRAKPWWESLHDAADD